MYDTVGPGPRGATNTAACEHADNAKPANISNRHIGLLRGYVSICRRHTRGQLGCQSIFAVTFLDHFDGALAGLKQQSSKRDYYLDYFAGAASYTAMFVGICIGLTNNQLGVWALLLGSLGGICAIFAMPLNIDIDTASDSAEAVGYPAFAGFELQDGIYLLAPVTWCGWLTEFFVLAGCGACV